MNSADTLIYKDGHVCVTSAYSLSDEPTLIRHYWSFGAVRPDNLMPWIQEALGKPVQSSGNGIYRIWTGIVTRELQLPEGGSTKAIIVETTPIDCPKVRKGIETRYYNGEWQKYNRSRGWITA